MAIRYVGRFATTRAKLRTYLNRKLRERGWSGEIAPDTDRIVQRFAELGYVDDEAFAVNKARALSSRGYGKRRLGQALVAAGVAEDDRVAADDLADAEAIDAALRFAKRRRLGPYGTEPLTDPKLREKALAAMIRAGHSFDLARSIISLCPDERFDADKFRDVMKSL